uniref:C2 domain containing 3 centriole elongation regulator n=1 Tax=Malurus cyaneus samueli TaxID=2593467 RepID=A0A8C5X5X5_9PASS
GMTGAAQFPGGGVGAARRGLPPGAPPRCFLRCTVSRLLWAARSPSGGTVFQPPSRAGQPAGRTCARFPVRCGPRQLAAYLADMGVLVLEVLTKLDHLPLGRAQITRLSQLSPSHPIKGSFAVVSPTSAKLGELQVSLALEPLPEVYDTSSSVPTTEGSLDTAAQGNSKWQLPAPSQQHTRVTAPDQESADSRKAITPRYLLFPMRKLVYFAAATEFLNNGCTLVSSLLDQGNKLRDAMVVSAMKSSPDMEIELNKMSHFIERDDFKAPTNPKGLKSCFVPTAGDPHHFGSEVSGQQLDLNSEERAIQLLLGSADFSPGHFWDRAGSLWDSLSLGSEMYDSELGDPHYDQSLLERLFYTTLVSGDPVENVHSLNVQKTRSLHDQKNKLFQYFKCHDSHQILDGLGSPFHFFTHSTFFVECHFPVGVSKDDKGQLSITTEVIRAASSKITDDVVQFQQRSVFPVCFGRTMIEHWWGSDLAFKIYMRKSTQKKAVAVGSAAVELRRVLQAELLRVSWEIAVAKEGDHTPLGPLKVCILPSPDSQEPAVSSGDAERLLKDSQDPAVGTGDAERLLCSVPPSATRNVLAHRAPAEEDGLLLHVLLMVPDGKDFVAEGSGFPSSCNVYLNCKLFNTEEATRSTVIWGTTQPAFNFSQVMPFSLTSKHLERLKNNVMIIEAWNKLGSPGCDKLLGLVKLPLHQFYISFKDARICQLLLQAQYPVVAVDGHVPVVDVFTGSTRGSLRVILAMGSADQIVALQRLKTEEGMAPPVTPRPPHSLDCAPTKPTMQSDPKGEELMEHVFEIHVESVKGLTPLQATVWGEADCYIQYYFPVQEAAAAALEGPGLHEDGISLKPFRTATTLCVPDPIFHDEHHHSLLVPAHVPVQRLLGRAFTAPGAAGRGMQFEVWCRYYYPNVRDQLVARGALPLSRLCAMVTMQHREEIGIQTFNLPLVPRTDSSEEFHLHSSGLLDVSVRYRRSLKAAAGIAAQAVTLSVRIHRAAGLQAAARCVAQRNPSVQYYAGVGVNAYVCVLLSFLPQAHTRSTRAVPCTFCPEFEHHMEFLCNLIIQKSSGETSSLGELLQSASIVFSIYHQSTKSATDKLTDRTCRDYLLGTVTVPTRDLLTRRSGIGGWYPVTLPEDPMPPQHTNSVQSIVGGLELSVAFGHQGDRERVLEAARLLGWSREELQAHSEDAGEQSGSTVTVTISTPRLWLPLHSVLLAGHKHLHSSTHCYLRYKLYNQQATCTWLKRPKLSNDSESVTVTFRKPSKVTLRRSQGLLWFFREEKLEIQVWWAYGKENEGERPLDTDRLIGSAYVSLAALAESSRTAVTGGLNSPAGVYPLFRCNAADLAGAAVRVHVCLAPTAAAVPRAPCAEECSSSEDEGTEEPPDLRQQIPDKQPVDAVNSELTNGTAQEEDVVFLGNTVAVNILVERAMHLSLKGSPLTEREVTAPSSCVTFAVAGAEAAVTTPVVENTDSPVWDFQHQARLSKELLLDPQQTLVFKVWHKAGKSERVIGFASVDLSPLLSGFQLVCGWYNITDFSGCCRGQIKVAVSPLQNISNLKEEKQARARSQPESSSVRSIFSPLTFAWVPQNQRCRVVSSRMSPPGTHSPRHEEHMQNVRRFHQSLQQMEGNTHRAARLESAALSSRAALLTALRKNLSELDEVQRYFSQKLTRSFPDFITSQPGHEEWESDHQGLMSREMDPKGCHLLEKSSQLVSQVSSLINDLQTITKHSKAACNGSPDSSRQLGAVDVPCWKEEGATAAVPGVHLGSDSPSICRDTQQPGTAGRSVFHRHMLHKLLDPLIPEDEQTVGSVQENEGAFAIPPHSEEEYEEDVIEPRTLNEITTITDRTSPWSSVISETGTEQHPLEPGEDQPSIDVGCFQKGNSSALSSILHGDSQSVFSALSPPLSPHRAGNSPWGRSTGLHGGSKEPLPGDGGLSSAKTTERQEQEGAEAANEDEGEEGSGSDENCAQSVSAQAGSERSSESSPDDNEAFSTSAAAKGCSLTALLRSDPVVVPNFFLPPQEMEASMRLLSSSSHPSTSPKVSTGCPFACRPCQGRFRSCLVHQMPSVKNFCLKFFTTANA